MDKNLSFKFTVTYSVDKENLACEDDTINELKESQKQIDKLKQHGEKLDTSNEYYDFRKKKIGKPVGCSNNAHEKLQEKAGCMSMLIIFVIFTGTLLLAIL